MKKTIQRWEFLGIVFIIVFGSMLHFLFEWSGYARPVAILAAVNESTWEHFKIAFWPSLIWALIEFPFLRKRTRNFAIAKAAGLATMPLVIAALFYGYTAFTGQHFLIADIVIFILAVIFGQWLSMWILVREAIEIAWLRGFAIGALVIMVAAYSTLSYYPPRNFLFAHPETGEFGILADYDHDDH
ncbi:MAG: DUF6512 family protein [Anaerolineales bacterium]|jgi:hypothetical protein